MQIVSENPRWHLVDLGQMSDSFLTGQHLRDEHHPKPEFMLQILNLYLNLQLEHGHPPRPALGAPGSVAKWDATYVENAEAMQQAYLAGTEAAQQR